MYMKNWCNHELLLSGNRTCKSQITTELKVIWEIKNRNYLQLKVLLPREITAALHSNVCSNSNCFVCLLSKLMPVNLIKQQYKMKKRYEKKESFA